MEPINLTSAEWLNDPTQSSSLIDLFELGRVIHFQGLG